MKNQPSRKWVIMFSFVGSVAGLTAPIGAAILMREFSRLTAGYLMAGIVSGGAVAGAFAGAIIGIKQARKLPAQVVVKNISRGLLNSFLFGSLAGILLSAIYGFFLSLIIPRAG
ncbi:MAG: hypothetical protein R3B84_01105 [Zavarzinella sp.]